VDQTKRLKQLSKAVFADDKTAACYYVDADDTFLNEAQYAARSKAEQAACVRIDNPDFEIEQDEDVETEEDKAAKAAKAAEEKAAKDAEKAAAKAAKDAEKAAKSKTPSDAK
jgi:hypothetical protein